MTVKFISAAEAAARIPDNSTVLIDGFISFCLPDDILTEIENRYVAEGKPRDLSVVNIAGIGGDGKNRGINHLAHRGLVSRLLCANLSAAPKIYPLVMDNAFPTFMIPQGVLSHMMRAIASKKPGVISQVGMKTFVDPLVDGGRINQAAWDSGESVVERIKLRDEDFLFYPAFNIDVAIIKGSYADHKGNISLENEAIQLEQLEVAAATKNCGGIVMVQVDELAAQEELHPQMVRIPSTMIDYVIVGKPENTGQHFLPEHNCEFIPSWSGHERIELDEIAHMDFGVEKVICRRSIMELYKGDFINLGIGMPMNVSAVLNEEGHIHDVSASIESGIVGGVPAPGLATGAAYNPDAVLKQPDIFDFYDGGGIDFACLGAAQMDHHGNVNVSRFAGKTTGPGGFINITQGAKLICFLGTFTAGREQDIRIEDGKLRIVKDGPHIKFKDHVDHITFSGEHSRDKRDAQTVFYITERAVFKLTDEGMMLMEIAPGIDLQKDVLDKMEFAPVISPDLKLMDARLFRPEKMELELKVKARG